jgi:hypothetical protein
LEFIGGNDFDQNPACGIEIAVRLIAGKYVVGIERSDG